MNADLFDNFLIRVYLRLAAADVLWYQLRDTSTIT